MKLDANTFSENSEALRKHLKNNVIGQDHAIDTLVESSQRYYAGLTSKKRPLGIYLLVGPTGVGKTKIVEEFQRHFIGEDKPLIRVDCGEFQGSHEITKILGAPPGYLGHNETKSILDKKIVEEFKPNVILFDEIEKASDSLYRLLLGILDKASLTLGNGTKVDFSQCFIFMTSNEGTSKLAEHKDKMGFVIESLNHKKIKNITDEALKKKFAPEFLNRLDGVIHFNTLSHDNLLKIIDLELDQLQYQIIESGVKKVFFLMDQSLKEKNISEANCDIYGARELKRVLSKHIVTPLSKILSSDQLSNGDVIYAHFTNEEIQFEKILTQNPKKEKAVMVTI